jgi:hypothetical protein
MFTMTSVPVRQRRQRWVAGRLTRRNGLYKAGRGGRGLASLGQRAEPARLPRLRRREEAAAIFFNDLSQPRAIANYAGHGRASKREPFVG